MPKVHDALVIGAGPAGATAALLLAQAGWSVVLLERKDFPRKKVCGEYLSATNLALLDRLGVGALFREQAGPPVRKVGLFTGAAMLEANLPRLKGSAPEWGRALSRERLDTLLLERARGAGAEIRQPWKVQSIVKDGEEFHCEGESMASGGTALFTARIVVAAHGSWDPGTLPTQPPRRPPAAADLLGFKAHFEGTTLASDLMPLLAFSGGYGGMVHCEGNRVSLSCCVRRDRLSALRRAGQGEDAGAAVLDHIQHECHGVSAVLRGAKQDGPWLAAGPIRPGIRSSRRGGIFLVGNAAGEAHPVIAEGISIALQSAWLLCRHLITWKTRGGKAADLAPLAQAYAANWRRHFASRVYLSQAIAQWAMRPSAVACLLPVLSYFPPVVACLARLSGKINTVV